MDPGPATKKVRMVLKFSSSLISSIFGPNFICKFCFSWDSSISGL